MMRKVVILVLQGLLAIVPITVTIYLLVWIFGSIESLLTPFIPYRWYFPGLGLLIALFAMVIMGLLVNAYIFKIMLTWWEGVFEKIPVVKTLYGTLKDAVNLISIGKEQRMQSVVSVEINPDTHLIGFITSQEGAQSLFNDQDKVGVYIPLSYQIGGYTVYIDKSRLTPLNIDVETAMRISLTGGTRATDEAALTPLQPEAQAHKNK
ncbi:DUF502 domain-containing protein [Aestuariibacter sp. AA17]|uniref:DUF502 domain-containing protein n=1 Tax=Fluctibacter corallii TaxID=2984329 RepID=A0ABT3A971_9ALTE|nr:DUF502 domain-containing protein [Aestuariibacter sp. AA17]MCV2885144.1 DUF502 domain-containing protein [Aestuariibacter sp. AA17]